MSEIQDLDIENFAISLEGDCLSSTAIEPVLVDASNLFKDMTSLKCINWGTMSFKNTTNFSSMFENCSIDVLDLSSFQINAGATTTDMLKGTTAKEIILPSKVDSEVNLDRLHSYYPMTDSYTMTGDKVDLLPQKGVATRVVDSTKANISIVVPKKIILDTTKPTASYSVKVYASDIECLKDGAKVTVSPDANLIMKQPVKSDISLPISQTKSLFNIKETNAAIGYQEGFGTISSLENLTAGVWTGTFNFSINYSDFYYTPVP